MNHYVGLSAKAYFDHHTFANYWAKVLWPQYGDQSAAFKVKR